jgi:hypothetical protein
MRKRNPRFAGYLGALLFLLVFVTFSTLISAAADETDLYHESLKIDSDGNLLMTTRDKRAGSGIRYKTIGWTLKKDVNAAGASKTVRLPLEQNGQSRADPNDSNYIFTYFKCDKSVIFAKIGAADPAWQKQLYVQGGMVYLDAIMTVVENGVSLGSMDENGVCHGEVYTTAAGIMNARAWADPQGLLTHYNKALSFPPLPEMVDEGSSQTEEGALSIAYGEEECNSANRVTIISQDFDVEQGIPTGETVSCQGQLQKFYYEGALTNVYGTVAVPVDIAVTYSYTVQTEAGSYVEYFTINTTFYVTRMFSYYKIARFAAYEAQTLIVENEALPVQPLELTDFDEVSLVLERDRDTYIRIPTYGTSVYGGDLSSGSLITAEELAAIAEATAGEVWVRNDMLVIDGQVILDGSYVERQTQEPLQLRGARIVECSSDALTIPHTKRNDSYETHALVLYREIGQSAVKPKIVRHTNSITVHTPVVCKGGITDDIAHNQQITPTGYFSLVLGRSFSVGISTTGTHNNQKGYGTRDYEKYVEKRQVCFPFEVYEGDAWREKDTWIDLKSEQQEFYLPVGVAEGDYQVKYRTVAKNADAVQNGEDLDGYLANLELSEYAASDELTVTVMGRMYDLAVTDIVDYPRWRSVFYTNGQKSGFAFWIGTNNLEGESVSRTACLPVLAGDHPYQVSAHAPGLGYQVQLQLKTIGNMRGLKDTIVLMPSYYYLSRDGSERRRVRLYEKSDLTECVKPLTLTAENRTFLPVETKNVSDASIRAASVQVWQGMYQLSADLYLVDAAVDLDSYIQKKGGRISQSDLIFLQGGYLLVSFEIRSYAGGTPQLSYANSENEAQGYCNMWKLQGFSYERMDCFGHRFSFLDGDCLLFDRIYSLHRDYESWGTH